MPFSITKRLERGESRKTLYLHIIRRTLLLYILGLIYNGLFDFNFSTLRYTGVLHRIAFTYFCASMIVMNFKKNKLLYWVFGITLIYWLILLLVPVPGHGTYNLTPQGNLGAWLDQKFLPGSFCCYQFGDNEGILTNFPAIVSVLIGVIIGHRLMKEESWKEKSKFFFITGAVAVVVGILWNFIYPINKYLWTGSYVALTSGLSILAITIFYWLIDIKGYKKWAFPFIVIGMNPITIYVIQGVFDFGIIVKIFIHGFSASLGSFQTLFFVMCVIAVKWLFLWFLYKQKLFLKV